MVSMRQISVPTDAAPQFVDITDGDGAILTPRARKPSGYRQMQTG